MMFKRFLSTILICICIAAAVPISVFAEDEVKTDGLPKGDILLIYSDQASDTMKDEVMQMVALLTYQSFQVTFAPASDCISQVENYSDIICYQVEKYPRELLTELNNLENTADAENENPDTNIKIMFVGNVLLKDYLNSTSRSSEYIEDNNSIGKITYSFDGLNDKEELCDEDGFIFLNGDLDYTSGSVEVGNIEGYVAATKGALSHISVSDINKSLVKSAINKEIAYWKWPYDGEPHIYAQYIVLDKVYPFQNPDKSLEIVNMFASMEEPFIISVMPIYSNAEYPSMQHFCEVLRYAQDNGGTIALNSPINQQTDFDAALVNEYMTTAIQAYMNQGVVPMAMEIPSNWVFSDDTADVISRFSTIIVSDDVDENITINMDCNTNKVYKDGHQWIGPSIALDSSGVSYTRVASTAVNIDMDDDIEHIRAIVKACQESNVPLKSLWDIEHSFWSDEDVMNYKNHIILVNGERIKQDFEPTVYEEKYEYNRNMIKRFSKDLSGENHKLIIAVVAVSIIFILFIVLARRNNRKRFFHEE